MVQKFKSVFDEIKSNPNFSTSNSIEWFRKNIKSLALKPGDPRLLRDRIHIKPIPTPGFLYMFAYEAQTEGLPYFDMFPLSFVFRIEKDGFYGINFHYLPPKLRVVLYDKMLANLSNTKFDETTRIKMNWAMLSNFSKFPQVKPAVKHYLYDGCQSNFLKVSVQNFKIAIMLPVEQFTGASKQKVWADSLKIIRNR